MRVPIRKPGKYTHAQYDLRITADKLKELTSALKKLKDIDRPKVIDEVKRMADLGDFSENAGYQIAKARLRGINQKISELEKRIQGAELIEPGGANDIVRLGATITVDMDGKRQTYRILGSAETNPLAGIISDSSPLGAALLGRATGDTLSVQRGDASVVCTIIKIE